MKNSKLKNIVRLSLAFLLTGSITALRAQDSSVVVPSAYPSDTLISYVRTWEAMSPQTNPNTFSGVGVSAVKQSTQYIDSKGRLLQTVVKKGSYPTNGPAVDMVSPVVYDQFGREMRQYLPFGASNYGGNTRISDGLFKLNPFQQQQWFYSDNNSNSPIKGQAETYYYSKTELEASSLSRVNKTLAAGNAWVNHNKAVAYKHWANKSVDSVRIWTVSDNAGTFGSYSSSAIYAAGQLSKSIVSDESNAQVVEFKDKLGNVVLKKVQHTAVADTGSGKGHTGWLCTYYIYDDLKQLRAVIQPRGIELLAANSWNMAALSGVILNEQTFRYEYDDLGRMTMKKVPGAGTVYMVYDVRDRLVFTQDSLLRAQNKWLATLYDNLNRPVLTGLMTYSGTLSTLQSAVTTQTATPGSPNTSLTFDLILTGSNQSGTKQAMRTISMEDEFETTTGGEFTAEINPGPGGPDGETSVIEGLEVNKNPIPSGATLEVLTQTFYDHYNWRSQYNNPLADTRNSSYDSHLLTASNTTFPYAQSATQSSMIKGLVTGTRTKVLGTASDYLYTVNFYDDKARVIQVQGTNITGGTDISTTQYSFAGQPLITVQKQQKGGTGAQTSVIVTKNSYDSLWRVAKVEKKLSNDSVNSGSMSSYVTIAENEYDALGQLKRKKLGNNVIDSLTYDYNIRGWLLGMNRHYARDSHYKNYFGFDLGYDKTSNNLVNNQAYTAAQYNGNIAGMVWKSRGDSAKRKYDFSYDAVNRLTGASFTQYNGGTFNLNDGIDFSVSGLTYDANGNIKTMKQRGVKGATSATIDSLVYTYMNSGNSNRLLNVIDGQNEAQTKLGDFRTSTLHPNSSSKNSSTVDYVYDGNGNMVRDLNKDIITFGGADGIVYNHLNLPSLITVKDSSSNKGTIAYTYDAAGNKLKKTVTEGSLVTTTLYLNGLEYKNDTLQFIAQEEGRIRYTPRVGAVAPKFDYDYFLKDHLGNVRMIITEERKQDVYPAATLEGSLANSNDAIYIENWYYTINAANVVPKSDATGITDYQNNNGNPPYNTNPKGNPTVNSAKLYKLQATATTNGGVTGLGMTVKVMSGDTINIYGKSYYFTNNTGGSNYNIPVLDILSGLLGAPSGAAAGKGATASGLNGITPIYNGVYSHLTNPDRSNGGTSTTPKAYINWVLFDENFKFVKGNFSRVGSASTVKNHNADLSNIEITKNGYLYVYCSNESPVAVFFDNLQVIHTHGRILEETHYYPFGLTMAGISTRALNFGVENKVKFQGQEFAHQEFSDGSGLEMYEFKYRMDDPQTGRFWQIDPLSEKYVYNSTYAFSENKVTSHIELEGLESVAMNAVWSSAGFTSRGGGVYFNPSSDLGQFYSWENMGNVMSKSILALGGIYGALDGFGFGLSGMGRGLAAESAGAYAESRAGGWMAARQSALRAGASLESINTYGAATSMDLYAGSGIKAASYGTDLLASRTGGAFAGEMRAFSLSGEGVAPNLMANQGTAIDLSASMNNALKSFGKPSNALAPYYPGNGGFGSNANWSMTSVGEMVSRYGRTSGFYMAPANVPFTMRGLPTSALSEPYNLYKVNKSFPVLSGPAAPAFGFPGTGMQYLSPISIQDLIDLEYLIKIGK